MFPVDRLDDAWRGRESSSGDSARSRAPGRISRTSDLVDEIQRGPPWRSSSASPHAMAPSRSRSRTTRSRAEEAVSTRRSKDERRDPLGHRQGRPRVRHPDGQDRVRRVRDEKSSRQVGFSSANNGARDVDALAGIRVIDTHVRSCWSARGRCALADFGADVVKVAEQHSTSFGTAGSATLVDARLDELLPRSGRPRHRRRPGSAPARASSNPALVVLHITGLARRGTLGRRTRVRRARRLRCSASRCGRRRSTADRSTRSTRPHDDPGRLGRRVRGRRAARARTLRTRTDRDGVRRARRDGRRGGRARRSRATRLAAAGRRAAQPAGRRRRERPVLPDVPVRRRRVALLRRAHAAIHAARLRSARHHRDLRRPAPRGPRTRRDARARAHAVGDRRHRRRLRDDARGTSGSRGCTKRDVRPERCSIATTGWTMPQVAAIDMAVDVDGPSPP